MVRNTGEHPGSARATNTLGAREGNIDTDIDYCVKDRFPFRDVNSPSALSQLHFNSAICHHRLLRIEVLDVAAILNSSSTFFEAFEHLRRSAAVNIGFLGQRCDDTSDI